MSIRRFFRRRREDAELAEEMESHLAHERDDNLARGLAEDEARRLAALKLGSTRRVREQLWQQNSFSCLENLWHDIAYALRQLRKSPGFTVTALLVLTLGIGANTTIFSLMYTLLLKDLPVTNPQQLVHVENPESGPFFDALRARNAKGNGPFQDVFGWYSGFYSAPLEWRDHETTVKLPFAMISGNGFQVLGLQTALGRNVTLADDIPGGGAGGTKCVLSDAFWKQHFNADPNVLGHVLVLNGTPVTIIGVLEPGFISLSPGEHPAVFLPLEFINTLYSHPFRHDPMAGWLDVFARLKPGVSRQQAQSYLDAVHSSLWNELFPDHKDYAAKLSHPVLQNAAHGFSWLDSTYRLPLTLLQGLALLTLLLCCVSLAGLFSARAMVQRREFILRSVLGASRIRLARQILMQVLPIVAAGVALSLIFSGKVAKTLIENILAADHWPQQFDLSPNRAVLVVTIGAALAASLLACLTPLRSVRTMDPARELKEGNVAGLGRRVRRQLGWWVPLQVGVATVLTMAAVLFGASLMQLVTQHSGLRASGLVLFDLDFKTQVSHQQPIAAAHTIDPAKNKKPAKTLQDEAARLGQYQRFFERLHGMPGIISASSFMYPPLSGGMAASKLYRAIGENQPTISRADLDYVGAGYFSTVGTNLVAGRGFDANDLPGSPNVCVLNALAAKELFPDRPPIGREAVYIDVFQSGTWENQKVRVACQVVGVTEDARIIDLHKKTRPAIYRPLTQSMAAMEDFSSIGVRTSNLSMAQASVAKALQEIAPGSKIDTVTPLSETIRESLSRDRVMAVLAVCFAGLALLITGVGLYGLLSYQVSQRKSEIGVRMAVGASRSSITGLFIRQAVTALMLGSLAGLGCAWILSRYAQALLYGVHPHAWWAYSACFLVLAVVAIAAAWIPARRAASIDPMRALRAE